MKFVKTFGLGEHKNAMPENQIDAGRLCEQQGFGRFAVLLNPDIFYTLFLWPVQLLSGFEPEV